MNTVRMPGCPTYSGPQYEAVPDAGDNAVVGGHQEKPLFLTCNLLEPVDVTIILLSKAAKAANDA